MSDLNVKLILRLIDRATGPARTALRGVAHAAAQVGARVMRAGNGVHHMREGMFGIASGAGRAALAMNLYSGAVLGLAAKFVGPAAQFERFGVQLTNLEGSAAGGKRAMAWIEDFATKTPLQLEDTVSAYARLKAFGVDPTNGSMQALVDTMAATGGGAEQLDGLVLALGQSWTKGKLQGEEAMQMLERGVPVWDLLSKKLGKTSAEVMEMASAGKLGRTEIQMLIDALGAANKGASEDMSKTWGGITSNLMGHWTRFQVMVMNSGVFDYLKSRAQAFLDLLNRMAADGSLQQMADQVAKNVLIALRGIWQFGAQVFSIWQAIYPILSDGAAALGGWRNALLAVFAVMSAGKLIGFALGLGRLAYGAWIVASSLTQAVGVALRFTGVFRLAAGLMSALGRGFLMTARFAGGAFVGALRLVGNVLLWMGRAAMANPIIAVVSLIAGAVYLIYQNWDGIVTYFTAKIDRVKAAFEGGLLNGVLAILAEFNPFILMIDAAKGLGRIIYDALDIDLFDKGAAMIASLKSGMWSLLESMVAGITAKLSSIVPNWMRSAWDWASGDAPAPAGGPSAIADGRPGRALGGPVRSGQIYRWMEEGQEFFQPNTDGSVISNRQLKALRPSAQGQSFSIGNITINAAQGQSAEEIARQVMAKLRDASKRSFALHDGGAYAG